MNIEHIVNALNEIRDELNKANGAPTPDAKTTWHYSLPVALLLATASVATTITQLIVH